MYKKQVCLFKIGYMINVNENETVNVNEINEAYTVISDNDFYMLFNFLLIAIYSSKTFSLASTLIEFFLMYACNETLSAQTSRFM